MLERGNGTFIRKVCLILRGVGFWMLLYRKALAYSLKRVCYQMAKIASTPAPNTRQETSRLASLVAELAQGEGISPSRLADVKFMRTTHCHPRSPVSYEPGIFIIVQ